ncbi:MAG: hypothetical protein H6813_02440 [Phycisphaeraceae bacterium]|nr:hypothetical protein [Phycisphaeraceae bacterium]MCB9848823.1 hypothetical protein [Phycisphaeraceae bacterium]
MDFDNPAVLFSGMLIGAIGLGLLIYGKKAPDFGCLLSGLALSVIPFFAHTMLALWGLSGLTASALYLMRKMA